MNVIEPRISGAGLCEEVYCFIHMPQKEMARTQSPVADGNIRVARVEPDAFLDMGDSRLRLTQPHQRLPELENCQRVVAVERDRRLELHLCFAQSVLTSAEYPHRPMRRRAVHIAPESFEQQL